MKRAILIVCALVVTVVLSLILIAAFLQQQRPTLLSKPPEHGWSFVIRVDSPDAGSTNNLAELKNAIQSRSARLGFGVYWEPISESRVRLAVSAPETVDPQMLSTELFSRGRLEFRLVHEESDQLIEKGEIPSGYEILKRDVTLRPSRKLNEQVLVKREPEPGLVGNSIKTAMVVRDQMGRPQIDLALTAQATEAFARLTRENVGRRLAIVLDGELQTAPVIRSPIETGRAQIEGSFDTAEACKLANMLELPLPIRVTVVDSGKY